jgi:formylglycine-generating enzyme required for sulfatase activity
MFDTPCTQALWEAVMGENPSRFQTPDRPVENVSWEDCQKFFEGLKERVLGLDIALPTEAEWEFSCRAGEGETPYNGAFEILGSHNAPALDPFAWYGGNSGVDFELADGVDLSSWSEKQYEFDKAGTHPVAKKKPNRLGLFDMLGNVDELCRDGQRSYEDVPTEDPIGSEEASAYRVIRGVPERVLAWQPEQRRWLPLPSSELRPQSGGGGASRAGREPAASCESSQPESGAGRRQRTRERSATDQASFQPANNATITPECCVSSRGV